MREMNWGEIPAGEDYLLSVWMVYKEGAMSTQLPSGRSDPPSFSIQCTTAPAPKYSQLEQTSSVLAS